MDKKTGAILATVGTTLACGFPGLAGLCMGLIFALAGAIPGAEIDIFGSSDPGAAITMGLAMLCISVILIAIPIVVGLKTLRNQDDAPIVEGESIS